MSPNNYIFKHRIERIGNVERFTFYCDLTGLIVYSVDYEEVTNYPLALKKAADEARIHFNRCTHCGKWVGDFAYDMDEMLCTKCNAINSVSIMSKASSE